MPGKILAGTHLPERQHPELPIIDFHDKSASSLKKARGPFNFPVKQPEKDVEPHEEEANQDETHLRQDIDDIGTHLNNVNNELYHVLTELLNGQAAGFENTLYNLRAKDYNAALPDRRRYIKPLLNPRTGSEHPSFYRDEEVQDEKDKKEDKDGGKGKKEHKTIRVPVTIEALEALSNLEKEDILTDLGMERDFNFLHNMISGPPWSKADRAAAAAKALTEATKAATDKVAAEAAETKREKAELDSILDPDEKKKRETELKDAKEVRRKLLAEQKDAQEKKISAALTDEKDFTQEKHIAQYLSDMKIDGGKAETEEMYATYLTTQLRVAVGLPRNYCPQI